jgi:hypothetical protein
MKGRVSRPVMDEYSTNPTNIQSKTTKQPTNVPNLTNTTKPTENSTNSNKSQNTNYSQQKLKKDYKIDPAVIPRPNFNEEIYKNEERLPIYSTGETNTPPPLSNTYFIVNETQNSSPRYVRSSLNKIPTDQSKLTNSSLIFGNITYK